MARKTSDFERLGRIEQALIDFNRRFIEAGEESHRQFSELNKRLDKHEERTAEISGAVNRGRGAMWSAVGGLTFIGGLIATGIGKLWP